MENIEKKSLSILNVILFLATVAINALANILPINGFKTGEVSAFYPNLFVPAGFTFAIWGVIYLGLTFFVLFQAGAFTKKEEQPLGLVADIGWLFVLSSLANIAWIILWHYFFIPSTLIVMVVLLLSLISINKVLEKRQDFSKREYWFVQVPFKIYLGWISVATIANVAAVAVDLNWGRFGLSEMYWTITMIVVAGLLGFLSLYLKKEPFFTAVIVWALFGIVIRHITNFAFEYPAIIYLAIGVGVLLIIAISVLVIRKILKT